MGAEQQQSLGDDIECGDGDRQAQRQDFATTDLLNRAAQIKSELGRNIEKLWQGLEGGVAKDHPIIDDKPESINEYIPVHQPASERTRTTKNQGRGR